MQLAQELIFMVVGEFNNILKNRGTVKLKSSTCIYNNIRAWSLLSACADMTPICSKFSEGYKRSTIPNPSVSKVSRQQLIAWGLQGAFSFLFQRDTPEHIYYRWRMGFRPNSEE